MPESNQMLHQIDIPNQGFKSSSVTERR